MTCVAALVAAPVRCDARGMGTRLRPLLENLAAPLSIAAYVAWAVIWIGAEAAFATLGPAGAGVARMVLAGFLLGFVLCISELLAGRPWAYRLLYLAMAAAALGLIAVHRSGVTPILLVLLVAVLAARLQGRELLAWFVALNLALVAIMAVRWRLQGTDLWISAVAHGSFQAFAALLMRTARSAEDMAEQLRATNAELLTTRTLLAESARDQERLRLSRELHDVAGHGLTALKLNLESLARDPRQPDPQRAELCASLADELLQNLRRVVRQMRDDSGIDLRAALERLGLPYPRPRLQLELAGTEGIVERDRIEAILRAVQEALTNAARHGHASVLRVSLAPDDGEWVLRMDDDGRAPAELQLGGGLSGMRERFEQLGGRLRSARSSLGGLRLEARWPREGAS